MSPAWYWTGATAAFAAELGSLAGLALGGLALPLATPVRVLAAVGAPLAAAVLWGLFAAPRSVVDVAALAVVTKVLVQGGAVAALAMSAHPRWAAVLGAAVVLGALLTAAPPARTA